MLILEDVKCLMSYVVSMLPFATRSGVTPSSVYSMLDPCRKEVSVNLVKKLCDGLEISLGEFFTAEIFFELEQEIR